MAIGGLAAQRAVASVIAGATTPEQVRANAAAGLWEPSADDLAALRAILCQRCVTTARGSGATRAGPGAAVSSVRAVVPPR